MKIRTQFNLLLAGIVLIPLLVFGAMVVVEYYRSPKRAFVPSYDEAQHLQTDHAGVSNSEWNKIKRFIDKLPPMIDVAILNDSNEVVFSSIEEIPSDAVLSDTDLLRIFRQESRRYMYQLDRSFSGSKVEPEAQPGSSLMVITRIAKEVRYKPDKFAELFRFVTLFFVSLLLCCALVIIFIARSVTRSVSLLEKSTRFIAEGNLDTEIAVKGSNEITSLTKSLNSMRFALKDAQVRRSRFIMGVSHDLRTPLALIKGYTEAIADGLADSPEMLNKSLEIIGAKIDQLEDMIDDLINFVKLDTGEWRQHLEKVALKPILDSYAHRLESDGTVLSRVVKTRIEIPADVSVPLDEKLFIRALENLCGNALRYTDDGGVVELTAVIHRAGADSLPAVPGSALPAEYVSVSVSDDGCGIAADDLPMIFDPFFRGSNSRREEGKGLGLSVVKTVADSFGWQLRVDSEKNGGSTFTIVIPL